MIRYEKCSNVDLRQVYEAIQTGFSDYIIDLKLSWEAFYNRFFEIEGNKLEYSYIAFDGDRPVGVIFGGLKNFEGVRTLRCGALCVAPDYRGRGVSRALYELHRKTAIELGCRQLFLEVIVGNDRAIDFYKKLGYEKVYDIYYYTLKDVESLNLPEAKQYKVEELQWEQAIDMASSLNIHINWQNQLDYAQKVQGVTNYGIYQDGALAGCITVTSAGKIFFIYTKPEFRNRGIAASLLSYAAGISKQNLTISFPNNEQLESFVKRMGFSKNELSQYEMYMPL